MKHRTTALLVEQAGMLSVRADAFAADEETAHHDPEDGRAHRRPRWPRRPQMRSARSIQDRVRRT
ncbi:MAG TPA: hypothetical protein VIL55_10550 [Naasia sp.]|jgi:hypothetical protein